MAAQETTWGTFYRDRCLGLQQMMSNLMARLVDSSGTDSADQVEALEDEIENLRARLAELEENLDTQRDLKVAFRIQAVRLGESLKQVRELAANQGLDLRSIEPSNYLGPVTPNGKIAEIVESESIKDENEDESISGSEELKQLKSHANEFGWLLNIQEVKLGEMIGRGSTADIFKGEWRGMDIAVKCLRPENFKSNADGEALYLQEVAILSRQHHPYILHMFAASLSLPDHAWIVSEYMPAGTLLEWLHGTRLRTAKRNVPLPQLSQRLQVAIEISTAMQFLHERSPKVLHRDLKPSNVFMDKHGHVRVADFSFARYLRPTDGILSGETGTYVYMAPEVMRHDYYDEKCDVYSFGVLLYEIVTGIHPYIEKPYTPAQIALTVALGRLRPTFPGGFSSNSSLKKLIQASWAQDPKTRPGFAEITATLKTIAKDPREVVDTDSFPNLHGYFSGLLFRGLSHHSSQG